MSFSSILLYCTGIFISITRECACDWHEEDSGKHVFVYRFAFMIVTIASIYSRPILRSTGDF